MVRGFTSTTPPTIYDNSLSGTTAIIYVPNEVYQDYLTAWADRSFIDRVQPKESE